MENYTTEQGRFGAGAFGDDYMDRNVGASVMAWKLARFTRIMQRTGRIDSVLELGANVGLNLRAVRALNPGAEITGVEINAAAAEHMAAIGGCEVHHSSILEWRPS